MTRGDRNAPARTHRARLRFLKVALLALVAGFGVRLVQLQVLEHDEWQRVAREQSASREEIPARRGGLYDRDGRVLASDGQEWRAFLAPRELRDPERAVTAAARILGLSPAERDRILAAEGGWVGLPRRISSADRERLMGAIRQGLHFKPVSSRVYPEGRLARPLLGAIDSEGRGVSGLERELDGLLRGTPGASLARRDALGETYWIPDAQLSEPEPGHDVVLTIDSGLQAIAENALDRALAETGASGGDIVLLDPETGELLAVASRRGQGSQKVPAFTDPYEPGSTLKPFLLAALLEEGLARLDEKVDVEGGVFSTGHRTIRDVHPHDTLTVFEVVQYSSNVGAVKLADRLDRGLQYRYLRDFGFGVPSGIPYPAESGGRLRRPGSWSALSQASLAMGYEISVTSLQLAAAYGALANGGVLMRPYLVREIRGPYGEIVDRNRPQPLRRVVNRDVAREVTSVLQAVVRDGTATRASLSGLTVAGKTGTARLMASGRYDYGRYAASFVGYVPAEDPRLVVLTKLEDPQGAYYGGVTAAPISQATLQAALATRGVAVPRPESAARPARLGWGDPQPEQESGPFIFTVGSTPAPWPGDADADAEEGGVRVLPDLSGMPVRSAVARLHALGLRVELHASGIVSGQEPGPGVRITAGEAVVLR